MIALLVAVGIAAVVLSVVQLITAIYGRWALFGNERGHGSRHMGSFSSGPGRSRGNTQGVGGCHPTLGFFTTTHYVRRENITNDVR